MRYKSVMATFSTQATILVQLPDVPGEVVMVHRVLWMVSSFSDVTAIALTLDHNVNIAVTLSTDASSKSQWWAGDQGASGGTPPHVDVAYSPSPYELVGLQRFDHIASVGTVSGRLIILYTTRREPNRTKWNELRSRTSFERD